MSRWPASTASPHCRPHGGSPRPIGSGRGRARGRSGTGARPPRRPPDSFLSVNLSPSALASREIRDQLPDDLHGIVIEITEEERVLDVQALQRHLDPLRARGARIAVDDAGEGYAGLQQVMSMRADIIKLDRALVADVHTDPANRVTPLVHFAAQRTPVMRGGIETLDELRVLIPWCGTGRAGPWTPGAAWPPVNAEAARAVARCARAFQGRAPWSKRTVAARALHSRHPPRSGRT